MADVKSFEINGTELMIKDEYARQQLDNIANQLGRNEDGTEIDMGTIATTIRGAIKELKDNQDSSQGSGGLDLSSLTITTESVAEGTKLILTDGTTTKNVTIPNATDTQVKTAIDALIADGTLSALTIENNSLMTKKLAIWDVKDINLFNKNDETKVANVAGNINISNQTGYATWDSSNSSLTGYVSVKPSSIYYIDRALTSGNIQICEYDENKTPIQKATTITYKTNIDGTKCYMITTSETTKYIRFIYSNSLEDSVMITENEYIENYMDYTEKAYVLGLEGENFRDILNENYKVTKNNVDDNTITASMTDFCFSDDLNLVDFNSSEIETDTSYSGTSLSNYFNVTNGETIYTNIGFNYVNLYDENKNLKTSITGETNEAGSPITTQFTIDCEGACYARINFSTTRFTNKTVMVTRYESEKDIPRNFDVKWFTLKDSYKEYFIKNVLSDTTFTDSIKNIMLPLTQHTSGKSYIAFGDSLLQYAGGNGTTEFGFLTQINKYLNMNIINKGYAGSSWTGTGAGDCKARINALIEEGIEYDVITLAWGTNQDENLGTIEDEANADGSMCAVMKWAVQQIRENFPYAGLGIIIPPPSISGGNETKVNLMIECCKHESMHVPYLDLFHSANITTIVGSGGLNADQVHLGEHGTNRYAIPLKPFIEILCPYVNHYKVTNTLTNCTNNNSKTSVTEGTSYSATITPNDGYALSSVIVTMNGVDITSDAYSNGKVTITSITGDIAITATTTTTE